jgi:hypothetical protein
MSNPTREQFSALRGSVDGNDNFMRGSAVFGNPHSGNRLRNTRTPIWALNDRMLRQVLLRAFPKMETNRTQERRALLWLEIIYNFYRRGLPSRKIAMELFSDEGRKKRPWLRSANPEKYVEDTVRRITRVAAGLRTTGKPRTKNKGRPKSIRL